MDSGGIMKELVNVFSAISDETRVRIVKLLEKKTMCVCELTAILGIRQPSVSHHLGILKRAGLVEDIRNGQWIDYRLAREKYNEYAPGILKMLAGWLNRDSKVLKDLRKAKKVSREKLCKQ